MEELKKVLEDYGMSIKEVEIYLTCLKHGACSVYQLSEFTGIPKSTCYDLLRSLKNKGLISSIVAQSTMYFEATDPEKIAWILEEKKRRLAGILPELIKMRQSVTDRPRVELYQGKQGIKTVLETVIKTKQELLIIGNFEKFRTYLDYYSELFVRKRIAQKIHCRLIEEPTPQNLSFLKFDKSELRKTKFLKSLSALNSECFIYGNNVALLTLVDDEPFGVMIDNNHVATLFKTIFEELWSKN